jgi:hypothetical protein
MTDEKKALTPEEIENDNNFYEGDDCIGERPENLEEVTHDESDS